MAARKDLLVLLLDVGDLMQPYLPLLHRMVFNALNCKLISKPNHEVAVVLYGTKGTRHNLYDPADPLSYHHVTVLRPLQNLGSYLDLEPFAFAADPPRGGDDGSAAATTAAEYGGAAAVTGVAAVEFDDDPAAATAATEALLARLEAAGLAAGLDTAAAAGRAARLFGPPGPKADWADGLVVALDLVASTLEERFDRDKREAARLGQLRVVLASNLLGQSEPYDEEFRATLVETCNNRRIALEVACLDHFAPPPATKTATAMTASSVPAPEGATGGEDAGGGGGEGLALLPAALAASRRRNLEQLHLLKSEMVPAPFRHLRQPAELLCLFRCKEVSYQASNAVLMLTPKPTEEEEEEAAGRGLPPPIAINVKLYKKIRRTIVDEWRAVLTREGASGGGEAGAAAAGGNGGGEGDDGDGAGGSGGGDRGFVREVEYEDPTTGQKFTRDDFVVKGYSYGNQAVPIAQYMDEHDQMLDEQTRRFTEKDFSLLGYVDADSVPHHRLIDEPHVVLGDSPSSAVAIASLALVLKECNRAGVVRFLLRRESPQLGLLTPHLSDSPDVPHALLLSPLPFAEDLRTHSFSTFRNQLEAAELPARLAEARGEPPKTAAAAPPAAGGLSSSSPSPSLGGLLLGGTPAAAAAEPGLRYERLQPDAEQQDAALALVRCLDLGPAPLGPSVTASGAPVSSSEPQPEALPPEATANPALQRVYELVTSRALDRTAQLPDPDDDPLVELVLHPHGRYWPDPEGARAAVRRAEELLRTREQRLEGEGPAAKRARREAEGLQEAAAAEGREAAPAAASATVVFDPSAAGGTSAARVTRVGELTAVEDFRAMIMQGRDSAAEAVQQLQELVRELVGRSIGDQLYDKAVKCVRALREGCVATGRAGAFNRLLNDLAAWCKSQDRGAFVSQLAAQGVGLVTHDDLDRHRPSAPAAAGDACEDDGGAVAAWEARHFLDQHSGLAEAEVEATLPAVVPEEGEFEDMD